MALLAPRFGTRASAAVPNQKVIAVCVIIAANRRRRCVRSGRPAERGSHPEHRDRGGDLADLTREPGDRDVNEAVQQRGGHDDGHPVGADAETPVGRLRKNGTRRVRITKVTRVWVASDSTNQPAWNRCCPAWNTHSMTPKVMKSNTELTGPKVSMNRRMKPTSQRMG